MFCEKCGTQINEGEKFCPACGAPVAQPEQTEYKPATAVTASPEIQAMRKSALILAIVGAALCSFVIPGIILCAMSLSKIKAIKASGEPLGGMGIAAKIVGIIGLVLSIVMIFYWIGVVALAALAVLD